jgi:hypothetical protein
LLLLLLYIILKEASTRPLVSFYRGWQCIQAWKPHRIHTVSCFYVFAFFVIVCCLSIFSLSWAWQKSPWGASNCGSGSLHACVRRKTQPKEKRIWLDVAQIFNFLSSRFFVWNHFVTSSRHCFGCILCSCSCLRVSANIPSTHCCCR